MRNRTPISTSTSSSPCPKLLVADALGGRYPLVDLRHAEAASSATSGRGHPRRPVAVLETGWTTAAAALRSPRASPAARVGPRRTSGRTFAVGRSDAPRRRSARRPSRRALLPHAGVDRQIDDDGVRRRGASREMPAREPARRSARTIARSSWPLTVRRRGDAAPLWSLRARRPAGRRSPRRRPSRARPSADRRATTGRRAIGDAVGRCAGRRRLLAGSSLHGRSHRHHGERHARELDAAPPLARATIAIDVPSAGALDLDRGRRGDRLRRARSARETASARDTS